MKTQSVLKNGNEIIKEIINESYKNFEFKKQLITNPKETIENKTGKLFDENFNKTIVVEDQTDTSIIYLNIPRKIDLDEIELTEEDLELCAGGDWGLGVLGGLAANALYDIGSGFYQAYKDFN